MTTPFYTPQADSAGRTQPRKNDLAGVVQASLGLYTTLTAPLINDIFNMSRLPAGCIVIGGALWLAAALDSGAGSATFDVDIGWADNGGASATLTDSMGVTWTNMGAGAASAAGLLDGGVFNMAAVTNVLPQASGWRPYNMAVAAGPVYFSNETTIQAKCIAAPNTYGAGVIYTRTDFVVIG